jgi:GNAT superfamily N-acetyltransferase
MAIVDQFRAEDRQAVLALYRRVFGKDAAEANQFRWEWQYERNPANPPTGPAIWLAREGPAIVGQYATMPVALWVNGALIDASWGMDVMVAPERQRQGLGEVLFGTWDQNTGASLGLGLSEASSRLFKKLRWPEVGPVPCLIKPLTRRAFRQPSWPVGLNKLVSAVTLPVVKIVSRARPVRGEITTIRRFDHAFTALWEKAAPKLDFAVRRDATYLQWKFIQAPHVRYTIAVLRREGEVAGYAVYRHVHEPRGRVTLLVDFLVDPGDRQGFASLLAWVDREARQADSDKIRCFCLHAGFRKQLRASGYFEVKSTMEFVARVNAVPVPAEFYKHPGRWHVTLGDSDQDR